MAKEKNHWSDKIYNETRSLTRMAIRLEELAEAFYTTGNDVVGDNLTHYAKQIEGSSEVIRKAASDGVNE